MSLAWSASAGATGYQVKRATTSSGPYTQLAEPASAPFTDAAVTNGTTYFYVVAAVGAGGISADSAAASATPTAPAEVPAAPTGGNATGSSGRLVIGWTAGAGAGATSYHVKRATQSGGPYTQIAAPAASPYADSGVTNGTTYYYVVSALNAVGESANSAQFSGLPLVSSTVIVPGTYYLVNVNSGLVLGFSGAAGADLQQATPTGAGNQLWSVAALGDGLYSITNTAANLAMNVAGAGGSGSLIDVIAPNASTGQQWIFTPNGAAAYTISPSQDTTLNLDIYGASLISGAPLQLYTGTNGTNQTFRLVPAGSQATVIVSPAQVGPVVTDQILGMNMAYWYDTSNAAVVPALRAAGIKALRWPGGSGSDVYHWATNFLCGGGYAFPAANFATFISEVVVPSGVDVAVTANYGTNAACTGPGDPSEAAAWVTAAKNNGNHVSHWTVGNEVYGSWETDAHPLKNDPATYATAVGTSTATAGYYPQMKAANPGTLVGVVVEPGSVAASGQPWDATVLSQASYDFVEYHFYAQGPGQESDAYLVGQAAQALTTQVNAVKRDLVIAGHPNTPIYVGELGSVYGQPGVQSSSITQALYAGQVLGELMNAGVSRATWWIGFGGCSSAGANGAPPNFSSTLYGWQNFGGYMVFSDGLPEGGCTTAPSIQAGTLLPTARAFELFSTVAVDGEHALSAPVAGDATDVRAYAVTHAGGTAIVLFNTNMTAPASVTVALSNLSVASSVTMQVYDKAIYDESKNNVWAPPSTSTLNNQALPITFTLTPWSMNVVTIVP